MSEQIDSITRAATKAVIFLKYPDSDPVQHADHAATILRGMVSCDIETEEDYNRDGYTVRLIVTNFDTPIFLVMSKFIKALTLDTLCYEARIVLIRPVHDLTGVNRVTLAEVPVYEARWKDEIFRAYGMSELLFLQFVKRGGDVIKADQLLDIQHHAHPAMFHPLESCQIQPYEARKYASICHVILETDKLIKEQGLDVDYNSLSNALKQLIQTPEPKKGS